MKKYLLILSLVLVCACSLTPRDTGSAFMFSLSAVKPAGYTPVEQRLTVMLPGAVSELDTFRIALTRDKGQRDYYAGARWAEFLPVLVRDSLTKTLEESGLFRAVTTDQTGLETDYILKLEIRSFQADYIPGQVAPVARIRMTASFLNRLDPAPIAVFDIKAERKAAGNRLSDIQRAFNTAFQVAELQLIDKLSKKITK